jgi:hypothetical protein
MACLQRAAHDVDIASAVKGVVAAAVRLANQPLLYGLALGQRRRVDEVGGAKLHGPLALAVVDVDGDDFAGAPARGAHDDAEADAAGAKDGNVGPRLNPALAGHDGGGAVARRDAAAQQAHAVHGRRRRDGHDRDVGHDGELRKGARAHKVQQVLAAALEPRRAVWHHAAALGGADLAAEVGLAGLAELAFAAFRSAGRAVSMECMTMNGMTMTY